MKLSFKIFKSNPRRRYLVIGVAFIIAALLFLLFSDHGIINRYKLVKQKNEALIEINQLKQTSDSLSKEINLLKYDTNRIEKAARENYGMIKPGEKVYFIKESNNKQ